MSFLERYFPANVGLKSKLIKSAFGVGSIKVLSIPLTLVVSIILARTLGPSQFGAYTFILSLITILAIPVSGGLPQLLTREIAGSLHQKEYDRFLWAKRTAYKSVIGFALIVIVAILIIASMRIEPLSEQASLLLIAIWAIPFLGFNAANAGMLRGIGHPSLATIPTLLAQPLFFLIVIGIYLFIYGNVDTETTMKFFVFSAFLTSLLFYCFYLFVRPEFTDKKKPNYSYRAWIRALLPFTLIAMVSTFNTQIGILLLGLWENNEEVAALRLADRAAQFVAISLAVVNIVIAPHIVNAFKEKDQIKLQKLVTAASKGAFFIGLPVALTLIFAGEWIIGFLYGDLYQELVYWPMVILILGQIINIFCGSVGLLLSMTHYEKATLKAHIISLMLTIGVSIILIPDFAAIGCATAVTTGLITWNLILLNNVRKKLGLKTTAF